MNFKNWDEHCRQVEAWITGRNQRSQSQLDPARENIGGFCRCWTASLPPCPGR